MSTWTEFSDSIPDELYDKIIQDQKHTCKVEGPLIPINMNNGTKTEYSLPAFLRDLRRSDKVLDQILTQQEEMGNPQLYAMETIISMMIDRENFLLQQLMQYKTKYGALE